MNAQPAEHGSGGAPAPKGLANVAKLDAEPGARREPWQAGAVGLGRRTRAVAVERREDDTAILEARSRAAVDAGARKVLLGQPEPAALAEHDRVLPAFAVTERLLRDAPVPDADDSVGDRRRRGIVADDDCGARLLPRELADHAEDELGVPLVQLAGRLVGEQQARPMGERGAHGHALLLAPGELSWSRAAPVGEPDALEELVGAREPGCRRSPAQAERQCNELASGELGR
jgi:hypothetical protein